MASIGTLPSRSPYSQHLPYASLLDDEAGRQLHTILFNLSSTIVYPHRVEELPHWLGRLILYITIHGNRLPETTNVEVIKLMFELLVSEGTDPHWLVNIIELLVVLIVGQRSELKGHLELPWQPMHNFMERTFRRLQSPKYYHSGWINNLEVSKILLPYIRPYFPLGTTEEILTKFPINFCPFRLNNTDRVTETPVEFLTTSLPPENSPSGYQLWFKEFIDICYYVKTEKRNNYELYSLDWMLHPNHASLATIRNQLSTLAWQNIGHIQWDPYLPKIFEMLSQEMDEMSGIWEWYLSSQMRANCITIVSCLGGDSICQEYLFKLLDRIEFEIGSKGHISTTQLSMLSYISKLVYRRVLMETWQKENEKDDSEKTVQYSKARIKFIYSISVPDLLVVDDIAQNSIPYEKRLTNDNLNDFVSRVMRLISISILNKAKYSIGDLEYTTLSQTLLYLCSFSPNRVIPPLITIFKYMLSEFHKITQKETRHVHEEQPASEHNTKINDQEMDPPSQVQPVARTSGQDKDKPNDVNVDRVEQNDVLHLQSVHSCLIAPENSNCGNLCCLPPEHSEEQEHQQPVNPLPESQESLTHSTRKYVKEQILTFLKRIKPIIKDIAKCDPAISGDNLIIIKILQTTMELTKPNDFYSVQDVFPIIDKVATQVSFNDYTDISLYSDLTENEIEFCKHSSYLESFVKEFLEKCLSMVDARPTRDSDPDVEFMRGTGYYIFKTFSLILNQCSLPLVQIVVDRLYNYMEAAVFTSYTGGEILSSLCNATFMVNNDISINRFLPTVCSAVMSLDTNREDLAEDFPPDVAYLLNVFSACVTCNGANLLIHQERILNALATLFKLRSEFVVQRAAVIVRDLLLSLSSIYYIEIQNEASIQHQENEAEGQVTVFPVRLWGRGSDEDDVKMTWHIPSDQEMEFVNEIVETYLLQPISDIETMMDGKREFSLPEVEKLIKLTVTVLLGICSFSIWDKDEELVTFHSDDLLPKVHYYADIVEHHYKPLRSQLAKRLVLISKFLQARADINPEILLNVLEAYYILIHYWNVDEGPMTWCYLGIFDDDKSEKLLLDVSCPDILGFCRKSSRIDIIKKVYREHVRRCDSFMEEQFTSSHVLIFKDLISMATHLNEELRLQSLYVLEFSLFYFPSSYTYIMGDLQKLVTVDETHPMSERNDRLRLLMCDDLFI